MPRAFDPIPGYDSDRRLEARDGVRIDIGPLWFQCLRAGGANKKFRRVLNEKIAIYQPLIAEGKMPDEQSERLTAELYAETVVLDWGGVTAEGKEIDYSVDAAVEFFTSDQGFEVFEVLQAEVEKRERFKRQAAEQALKN
jgi:hypothetical protein